MTLKFINIHTGTMVSRCEAHKPEGDQWAMIEVSNNVCADCDLEDERQRIAYSYYEDEPTLIDNEEQPFDWRAFNGIQTTTND